ncbi:MAG: hypothetical protein LQ351_004354 [Letrouitia transgressa]|nr:MAG: hypothetical protein LQ351_004354 [Letrouitia transgressa]
MRPASSSSSSFHFFATLHRYLSPHHFHPPLQSSKSNLPLSIRCPYPHRSHPQARHASTTSKPFQNLPATGPTHYSLFPQNFPNGPPPASSFHVDPTALRKEFLQLQARAHPDRHPGTEEKLKAEAASARINDAYKTLLNPLLRARYLLSLRGVDVGGDESIANSTGEPTVGGIDGGFLMEVMEVREEVEGAESREEVEEMKVANEEKIRRSEEILETIFRDGDVEGARKETVKLGYWVNVRTALDGWEKVGDGRVSEHD